MKFNWFIKIFFIDVLIKTSLKSNLVQLFHSFLHPVIDILPVG